MNTKKNYNITIEERQKENNKSKLSIGLATIIISIIGIVATIYIGYVANEYSNQQNKINKTNNYFQIINTIGKDNKKSFELLFFAYKESPEQYEDLLKY